MRLSYLLALFLMLFFVAQKKSHGAVWVATETWNEDWENKYNEWIKSEEVTKNIFAGKAGNYAGVKLDCADVAYALRAVFSFEHGLPYMVKNPVATKTSKMQFFTNDISRWDKFEEKIKIVKFIQFLADSLGSETLSFYDTYPLQITAIRAGDVFMWKIPKPEGVFVRHTYILKDITARGNFDLLYSTQAARDASKPLYYRTNQQISATYAPRKLWGFKRLKLPDYYKTALNPNPTIPANYSDEQYKLVQKLGGKNFFKLVKKTLQSMEETVDEYVTRNIQSLCTQMQDRDALVNETLEYLKTTNNKCMEYAEYDTYSTPSKDLVFQEDFQDLKNYYADLVKDGETNKLTPENLNKLKFIFDLKISDELRHANLGLCELNLVEKNVTYKVNLRNLNFKFSAHKVSFHPNDSLFRRWGNTTLDAVTTCKTWYGQE